TYFYLVWLTGRNERLFNWNCVRHYTCIKSYNLYSRY
ncbi:Lipoprotein-releasing system transmembrane protein LolE, partial [Haemophilus influenzae]